MDSIKTHESETARKKQLFLALFIALVPAGIIVNLQDNLIGNPLFLILIGLQFCVMFHIGKYARATDIALLFTVALVARVGYLFFQESDDMYRYIWEGMIQHKGYNPFILAPNSADLAHLRPSYWAGINHPSIPAVYWPVSQILFKAITFFTESILAMKLFFVAFDLAIAGLLWKMLGAEKKQNISLYLFNPLVLFYIAGEGHLEILPIFFVVLALYLYEKGYTRLLFLALGAAAMVKVNYLMFVPIFFTQKTWKSSWLLVAPGLLFLFYVEPGFDPLGVPVKFGSGYGWNGPLASLIPNTIHYETQRNILASIFFVGSGLAYFLSPSKKHLLLNMSGLFLLCTPNFHPWYLLMVTPFLVFAPNRMWLTLHLTVFVISFYFKQDVVGFWKNLTLLQQIEFLPPLAIGLYALVSRISIKKAKVHTYGENLSLIVPVLNEEERIGHCITKLSEQAPMAEIILVDGGSTDDTIVRAELSENVRVTNSEAGRGIQIAQGVRTATREICVIVHADAQISEHTFGRIESVMRNPNVAGGACGFQFDVVSLQYRFIQLLNSIKVLFFGISFGDQLQFFRRKDLVDIYPDYYLMEDVELALIVKTLGEIRFLPQGGKTSSRRWEKRGFSSNTSTVLVLLSKFLFLRQFDALRDRCKKMYGKYYG